jgi:helix-turn-helix protein
LGDGRRDYRQFLGSGNKSHLKLYPKPLFLPQLWFNCQLEQQAALDWLHEKPKDSGPKLTLKKIRGSLAVASNSNSTSGNSSDNSHAGDYGGYYRTQDRLFDWYGRLLGPIAIAVYNYLARCADQKGCSFPSYEDIALKVGISRRAAIMAITKLGRYRLIEIQHRKNRREKRGNYTSNRYKIRVEAFTHAGAHREVVHEVHQVVHEVHSKDYTLKDNPNKEKERGGNPPLNPPDSLSFFKFFPRGDNPESRGKSRGTRPTFRRFGHMRGKLMIAT